jgi:hypothetical protein
MASIERTAYPRLKSTPHQDDLDASYTPTPRDLAFAAAWTRGQGPLLAVLVQL